MSDLSDAFDLRDQVVLVTGGTGSFGSTVARRLLTSGVGEMRILSRDEAKQDDLRRWLADSRARFYVGDVRDHRSVSEAMAGVDHVFHAAALKQVPSCEFFPAQAVATNVSGSYNVIDAAHANNVRSVVCLSTDKAVYPVNAMGMTKALMEKVAQAFARNHPESSTVVSITRYGNVMCSRGSVIPLFVEQLRAGRPLTVTDPRMTRFIMSLDESVELVQHAFANAEPGDLFVKKARACTLEALAYAVARVMGLTADIQVIGTRHGEKLYESLISREERARSFDEGDYFRIPLDARALDYSLFFEEGEELSQPLDEYSSHNTHRLGVDEVEAVLRELPEMQKLIGAAQ